MLQAKLLHADETEVIGLDDDFNMLQAKLLDHDLPYGVVSIVGMPGLGKTTLAKKLFRHVRDQFECSGLVYVSQQPRAGEILHDIAKQVGLMEEERKENLENNLRSLLKTKRYVILLDDIWDVEIWDQLKLVLPECNPVPTALEVLKLRFSMDMDMSEQINLSSYPNIVKLHLKCLFIQINSEAFPPNLVKFTLGHSEVESHVVPVLKKLPKLRILKMVLCKYNEEKMDLSGDGDSFPQLEVLHIVAPVGLSEVTCMNDVSMPKLKKLLLIEVHSPIRLSERFAKLRV